MSRAATRRSRRLREKSPDETSELPPRVANRDDNNDNDAQTFRFEDSNVQPAPQRILPMAPAADSSDDDEDSLEWAKQPATPILSRAIPVPARAVHAPAPALTPAPVARPNTNEAVRGAQERRRELARTAIETIRLQKKTMQSGARIPGYNDTPALAQIDDAERDVVIDQRAFGSLLKDSPGEYQDANKPPWAPRLPAYHLKELMTWEAIEVFTQLQHQKEDWYKLVRDVAGLVHIKESAFIRFVPATQSTEAVAPTQSRVRGDFGIEQPTAGATELTAALRGMVGVTPARGPGFFGSAGTDFVAVDGDDNDNLQAGADANLLQPLTREQIQRALVRNVQSVIRDPSRGGQTVQSGASAKRAFVSSGARFDNFRKRARADAPPTPAYVNGPTDEDRKVNQLFRAQTAAAQTWVSRSVATGVFYLSPTYTAARDSAHVYIISRAPHLADVKLRYFARDDPEDNIQKQVRFQFAGLIADIYNMTRHNSNRSAKLATDAKNIAESAEDKLRWFITRVRFSGEAFYFSGATEYAEVRAPPSRAVISLPPANNFCDPRSLVNPLLYVPGTIYRSANGRDYY